jgi:hypothetical protein
MKIPRHTIKQIQNTTISETVDLEGLKLLFPYDWEKKLEELKKSKFKSVLFPE